MPPITRRRAPALEQGLHVVLEKPMTLLAAHARHLTELSRANGCQLIIGYPWNYNPHVLRVKEVISSGRLGGIRYINNMFASSVISLYRGNDSVHDNLYQYPVTGPGDVYSDPERSGGGQGHLQATHSVGLMLHMTGLRPVSVLALMDNLDTRVDVVDAMIAQMDNGALANVGSTGTLHAGGPEQEMVVQIYCDRGWINANIIQKSCTIYYADGSVEELPPVTEEQSYLSSAPANNLVDVIVRGAPNRSPAEVGWRTVELLDAAYRSAADGGRRVPVSSLYGADT